jgi:hypothetical protein
VWDERLNIKKKSRKNVKIIERNGYPTFLHGSESLVQKTESNSKLKQ